MKIIIIISIVFILPAIAFAGPPGIYAPDGTYLGNLSSNPYDPNSVSNPYGQYGSPYSPYSINNPYGQYGSPYSPNSPNNPYAVGGQRPPQPYRPYNTNR
jgi:hypothetical protein